MTENFGRGLFGDTSAVASLSKGKSWEELRRLRSTKGRTVQPPVDVDATIDIPDFDMPDSQVSRMDVGVILDMKSNVQADPLVEEVLQREAAQRRKNLSEGELELDGTKFEGKRKGGLGKEEEFRLGREIQEGVRVLKIKDELEEDAKGKGVAFSWSDFKSQTGLTRSTIRKAVMKYRIAKNTLVTHNLPLVHAVVRNTYKPTPSRTYEDMVQEGSTGLLRAAELYDPGKGLRFSTYAVVWIKGVLGNSRVGEGITVPLRERTKINKIRKFVEGWQGEGQPSLEEIGEGTGMKVEEVREVSRRTREVKGLLSIDYVHDRGKGGFNGAELDKSMWADYEMGEIVGVKADVVRMLVSRLTERERRVIVLRYGLDGGGERSLEEVGRNMGLSKERVRGLNKGVVEKLKEAEEAKGLEEYLMTIC